jgi:hypothetical protein
MADLHSTLRAVNPITIFLIGLSVVVLVNLLLLGE